MNRGRLWAVCRLDLLHALRRPLFWIWLLIVALCVFGLASGGLQIQAGDSATGGVETHLTSEYANALELILLSSIFFTFFVAVAAGMGIIQDGERRIDDLLHSTPMRVSEYVWGRFGAALICCFTMLGIQLVLSMLFKHALTLADRESMIGEFALLNYVKPALVFVVPLIVLMAGVSFAIGERFRRPVLVNMFPLALLLLCAFLLWQWTPSWLDPRINRALMLVDPTGFRWLNESQLTVDRGADFYNTASLDLDLPFVLSRIAFVALGFLAVASSRRHLDRTLRGKRVSARQVDRALHAPATAAAPRARERRPLAELHMSMRRRGFLASALTVARAEMRDIRSHPALWLFVPLIVLNSVFDALYRFGPFDTKLLATPGTTAVGSLAELTFALCFLLMFFTIESLQREKGTRLDAIAYATPVRTEAILFGKALGNAYVGLVTIVAMVLPCAIVILVKGKVALSLTPYLVVYVLILGPTLLIWNAFIATIYAVSNNRFVAYALGLGALFGSLILGVLGKLSWQNNWSLQGAVPWSDMAPMERDFAALVLNRCLVLSVAVLLIVVTARVFPRRGFDPTRILLRLRPLALLFTGLRLSPFLLVPFFFFVPLHCGIEKGPDGDRSEQWAKRYWRKNLRTWLDAPSPDITLADVAVELEPARRWFHTQGTYDLANATDAPLRQIALTGAPHWEELAWTLDGETYEPDDREGLYVFTPAAPLAPGDACQIGFDFEGVVLDGFTENGGGTSEFILPSGIVLTSFTPSFVPVVGFQEGIGVDDDNRYDSREYPDDFYEGVTKAGFGPAFPHPVKLRITAPVEYTLNGVGVLTDSVEADGKRTVTWESDHPVNFFNIIGGKWDVRRGQGTALFYHPAHDYNVAEMIEALDGAREFYSAWFYPYPWAELKVSEFPALAGYAQGFPTNISFSEAIGFLTDSDPKSNVAFAVTAHESAHQWWGNILMPGDGPGGNLLSEGTAHFSTILLFDQVKGLHQRIEFCKRIEESYCDGRVVDSERELVKIDGTRDGDTTVTYDKAGWVFWMLLNRMGREAALDGIRDFMAFYTLDRDHPVLQDFVAHLRRFAPDAASYDDFVHQWFFEVVLPEYDLSDVTSEPVEGEPGAWEVVLTLRNAGTGTLPVEVSAQRGERFPDEEVDAPVDAPAPEPGVTPEVLAAGDEDPPEPFRESRITVTLGAGEEQQLRIRCAFEPERVVVDPDALVLQNDREHALEEL